MLTALPFPRSKMLVLNAKTSADQILANKDLSDKLVIVTGANAGIGFETARSLASAGAHVIFACRSATTGQAAVNKTRQLHPNCQVEFIPLDLASASSIVEFSAKLDTDKIDILICNAGLIATDYQQTQEGLEQTVGVCHFGHFLLTTLLMPRLLNALESRVVMVSSEAHRSPKTLDFSRFPLSADTFGTWSAYGQAKLANVLMANELQRRYGKQGLSACSLHPGTLVTTEIGRGSAFMRIMMKLISPLTKNANQGAATTVYCAVESNPRKIAGLYFSHCQPAAMSTEAADETVAQKLWALSEEWAQKTIAANHPSHPSHPSH